MTATMQPLQPNMRQENIQLFLDSRSFENSKKTGMLSSSEETKSEKKKGPVEWEELVNRVAKGLKPLGTIQNFNQLSPFKQRHMKREIESNTDLYVVESVDEETGASFLSVMREDSRKKTLGTFISAEEKEFFGEEAFYDVFHATLENYAQQCSISTGQNFLECALVFGYPLDRARETL